MSAFGFVAPIWFCCIEGRLGFKVYGSGCRGCPEIRDTFPGVPIRRIPIYRGLYWGALIWQTTTKVQVRGGRAVGIGVDAGGGRGLGK